MATDASPGLDSGEERVFELAVRHLESGVSAREELRKELNGDGDLADRVFVEMQNLKDEDAFHREREGVAVFMPHCLKDTDSCRAEKTEKGYLCKQCMGCEIGEVKGKLGKGVDVHMVPGGGMIKKILGENDYEAVVGVACYPELELGKKLTDEFGLPAQMVPLSEDGCQETSVEVERVLDKLEV